MARNFSSARLTLAAAPVTAPAFTMAFWGRPTTAAGSYETGISIGNGSTVYHFLGRQSGGPVSAASNAGGGLVEGVSGSNTTQNAWNHFGGVWASTISRKAYLNGVGGVVSTTSAVPAGLTTTEIGTLWSGTNPFAGDICEAAIWNVALDDGEMLALGKGVCPLLIRPQSLIGYWPVYGNASPEPDRWNSNRDMTVTSTTKADHYPVMYGSSGIRFGTPAQVFFQAVAGVLTSSGTAKKQVSKFLAGVLTSSGTAATAKIIRLFRNSVMVPISGFRRYMKWRS